MLSLVKNLFGRPPPPDVKEEDASDDGSPGQEGATAGQAATGCALDLLKGDFFVLDGGEWTSLADGLCSVTFDEALGRMYVSQEDEEVEEVFNAKQMTNVQRYDDPDDGYPCVQWIVVTKSDNMSEWGLKFRNEEAVEEFVRQVEMLGQAESTIVVQIDGLSMTAREGPGEWSPVGHSNSVMVMITQRKDFEAHLVIFDQADDSLLYSGAITAGLGFKYEWPKIMFLGFSPLSSKTPVLAIECPTHAAFASLCGALDKVQAERRFKKKIPGKPKATDNEKAEEFCDVADEEEPAERSEDASEASTTSEAWSSEDEYGSSPVKTYPKKQGTRDGGAAESNKLMGTSKTVGGDRAFVWRTKVLRMDSDGLEQVTRINNILYKGEGVCPTACMMHEGDNKMLLLDHADPADADKVLCMDLNVGKVVQEWNADSMRVNNLIPTSKTAQSTGEQCFMGMNDKAIFVMDPRLDSRNTNRAQTYAYASNVKLSAAATDGGGRFALGNRVGEYRLFDGQTNKDGQIKRCKTLLKGTGDPITKVDVTFDGRYLLGTTAKYLVLIDTQLSGGVTGFDKSMGQNAPELISISLSQEDFVKYGLKDINFTPARFECGASGVEETIVTTTGSLMVSWSLKDVLRGKIHKYSVKPMGDYIVATESGPGASESTVAGNAVLAM
ncbi:vacuolar import and degradation protein 27 [Perkinsus olseni]|uniref:Vacuolar import and degradation protein 27 n=1 Tax=Perkinsus olseni TaxID=32597 RepID=A0A7J6PBB1_PEROL|nr:vacuolar import and degradation protein 27 [Perkinsus olseni]